MVMTWANLFSNASCFLIGRKWPKPTISDQHILCFKNQWYPKRTVLASGRGGRSSSATSPRWLHLDDSSLSESWAWAPRSICRDGEVNTLVTVFPYIKDVLKDTLCNVYAKLPVVCASSRPQSFHRLLDVLPNGCYWRWYPPFIPQGIHQDRLPWLSYSCCHCN